MTDLKNLKKKVEQFSAGGIVSKKENAVSGVKNHLDRAVESAEEENTERFVNHIKGAIGEIFIFAHDAKKQKLLGISKRDLVQELKDALDEQSGHL